VAPLGGGDPSGGLCKDGARWHAGATEDADEWTRALLRDPSVLASKDALSLGSGSHGPRASVLRAGRGASGAATRGEGEGVDGEGSGGGSASAGTNGENDGSSVAPGSSEYLLSHDFALPGLTVAPPRICLP